MLRSSVCRSSRTVRIRACKNVLNQSQNSILYIYIYKSTNQSINQSINSIIYRNFASSLGTPDLSDDLKAGERKLPEKPLDDQPINQTINQSSDRKAGERRLPGRSSQSTDESNHLKAEKINQSVNQPDELKAGERRLPEKPLDEPKDEKSNQSINQSSEEINQSSESSENEHHTDNQSINQSTDTQYLDSHSQPSSLLFPQSTNQSTDPLIPSSLSDNPFPVHANASINDPIVPSINQSMHQPVTTPITAAVHQSFNQSTNQSSSQSTNQSSSQASSTAIPAPAISQSISPSSLSNPAPTNKNQNPKDSGLLPSPSPESSIIRGVLWFDCVYPMQAFKFDPRQLIVSHNHEDLIPSIIEAINQVNQSNKLPSFQSTNQSINQSSSEIEILSMIPRIKEGGVFVHFEVRKSVDYNSAADVATAVIRQLTVAPVRARLTTRPVHCHLVKGDPFIEDLLSRFPSARLKIEIRAPASAPAALADLTVEHLFGELRAFGRIYDLVLGPFVKDQPRQASVQFRKMHGAVGARNCLHRTVIYVASPVNQANSQSSNQSSGSSSTPTINATPLVLYMSYDSILKTSYVVDFAQKHPRLFVPLIGLLLAAFTFLIFDPLRSFNIHNKITKRFTVEHFLDESVNASILTNIRALLKHRIFDVFRHPPSAESMVTATWSAREADQKQVDKWLASLPDRILFLTGPKGSGKQALVNAVTGNRENVLFINFGQFIDRNDEEFIKGISQALGFAPGFSLLTWLTSIMDIFTPGASKATGSSSAFGTQVAKILEVTTNALVNIEIKNNKKSVKNGKRVKSDDQEQESAHQSALDAIPTESSTPHSKSPSSHALHLPQKTIDKAAAHEADNQAKAQTNQSLNHVTMSKTHSHHHVTKESGTQTDNHSNSYPQQLLDGISSVGSGITSAGARLTAEVSNLTGLSSQKPVDQPTPNPPIDQTVEYDDESFSRSSTRSMPQHEDSIPLFIIEGFSPENSAKHSAFMNEFLEWASAMTSSQLARFLLLTDSTLEEMVAKQLPDIKTQTVSLSDANAESALQFVLSSTSEDQLDEQRRQETEHAVTILGGRFSDLVSLIRQLESGASPLEAAEDIVNQASSTVKNLIFSENKDAKWTRVQLWQTVEMLVEACDKAQKNQSINRSATHDSTSTTELIHHPSRDWIGYDDCLFSVFQGDDNALKGLIRADLLRVETRRNDQNRLRAGSPVTLEALKRLVHDSKFRAGLDVSVAKAVIASEQKKVNEFEDELSRLNRMEAEYYDAYDRAQSMFDSNEHRVWYQPWTWNRHSNKQNERVTYRAQMTARREYLLAALNDAHNKMNKFEQQRRKSDVIIKQFK